MVKPKESLRELGELGKFFPDKFLQEINKEREKCVGVDKTGMVA